jgi:hypothetical protein
MGPGFLPTICSWLIVSFGIIVTARAFVEDIELIEPPVARPVIMISLAVGLFALLIERAGLGIAVFVTAFVSSYAGQEARFTETLVLSFLAAVATVIVFVLLLGLQIPLWPDLT